ncbi:MAG: phosphate signaling complex protein PhoU [Actinomycetota bacterium]|nr:phosphate signaling complex protein PhoU [Actinomycetota bacterium]
MRAAFHDQLDEISDLLAEMAVAAGAAMNQATQALLDADLSTAEAVISADDHLDELTSEVERRCYDAAALQQPVATDLRLVIGSLRISSALERMGDLAVHVAKQARLRYPNSSIPNELRATFAELGALEDAIAAKTAAVISTKDLSLGPDIEKYDEEVDRLHREMFTTVLSPSWSHGVEAAIDATLLSRYYERYADHAVSIARRVMHVVTGEAYSETSLENPPPQ